MADLQKTIEIIFSGVDELSGPMGSMAGDLSSFSAKVEAMAQPFAKAADAILKVDAAIVALATGSIVMAAKQAGEFSGSMNEVNTLLDISGDEFLALREDVLNYATTSTASLDDLTGALYQLISMGVDYKDSVQALETIEYAATAGRADMISTTETLIGTMNAYGAGMDEITRYSDAYFTIIKDGKTTLPELAGSLADVTGIAALAGIPFETLGAAVAALTAAGTPTAQAVTQIKAAIQALISPTDAAKKAAEELGVEIGASAIESKGFEVVLREVYEAAKGNPEIINEIIPSIRGLAAAAVLGADSAGVFAKALDDMATNTGATLAAFDKMKDNLDQVWQNMLTNMNVAFIKFGLEFEGETTDLVKAVSAAFASIGTSVDQGSFDPMIDLVKEFGERLTTLIEDIARNFPEAMADVDFSGLTTAISDVVEAIENLFGDVDLRTPEGLTEAIQNVINTLETLATITAGMADGFRPFIEGIKGIIHSVNEMDEESQKGFGELIASAKAVVVLGPEVAAAIVLIGDAAGKMALPFEVAIKTFTGAFDLIKVGFNLLLLTVVEAVDKVMAAFELLAKIPGAGALKEEIESIRATYDSWRISIEDNLAAAADSAQYNLTGIAGNFAYSKDAARDAKGGVEEFAAGLELLPSHKQTEVTANADSNELALIGEEIDAAIPDEKETQAMVNPDEPSIENTKSEIDDAAPEEKETDVKAVPDQSSFNTTKSAINEIPESKLLEIQLQGDIDIELAEIEARAETIQTAFEWKAKVDIAEIEAGAKVAVAAFDSIGDSVTATAAATADMFSSLLDNWENLGWVDKRVMEQYLQKQMAMQQQALNMQEKLIDSQVEYMNAKADALRDGDGLIKIESDGLEPALEMIMWHILEKVQLRVNEEAAEFLLGLNPGAA